MYKNIGLDNIYHVSIRFVKNIIENCFADTVNYTVNYREIMFNHKLN